MKHTLELLHNERIVFYSDRKWLYPLFDLENYLSTCTYPVDELIVKDKVVGKAAALMHVYLKITIVNAGTISHLACDVFDKNNVRYEFENLVSRISCKTEEILRHEFDAGVAYSILKKRAKLE